MLVIYNPLKIYIYYMIKAIDIMVNIIPIVIIDCYDPPSIDYLHSGSVMINSPTRKLIQEALGV